MNEAVITVFNEEGRPLIAIFKYYGGHPEGLGVFLRRFLKDRTVIRGNPNPELRDRLKIANGMGDLAAQLICELKKKSFVGDVYISPIGINMGVKYIYNIRFGGYGHPVTLEVRKTHYGEES
ncbi:hypothetical protein DRO41_01035 [Candidatus Bathyarchaeota archaeon]|nr:MAG: hypothetical protein DRO41_01035 [Candidatus Bathyarchaeota archaeon]